MQICKQNISHVFFIKTHLKKQNMHQLQSKAADMSTLYKMLVAVFFHCAYRNSLNEGILNKIYLPNNFIHIKGYRDYKKRKILAHNYGNNINSIGTHVRNKI